MTQKRIDIEAIAPVVGTLYPPPFDQPCRARRRQKLGDAAGLREDRRCALGRVCGILAGLARGTDQ